MCLQYRRSEGARKPDSLAIGKLERSFLTPVLQTEGEGETPAEPRLGMTLPRPKLVRLEPHPPGRALYRASHKQLPSNQLQQPPPSHTELRFDQVARTILSVFCSPHFRAAPTNDRLWSLL